MGIQRAARPLRRAFSLRRIILLVYTPAVCLCMLASSVLSYFIYRAQLQEVATLNALNTVSQGTRYLNSWLEAVFEDLAMLEQYTKVNDLYLQRDIREDNLLQPQITIRINEAIQTMVQDYENIIDRVFWGVQLPDGRAKGIYFASDRTFDCRFSWESSIGGYRLADAPVNEYIWLEPHYDQILLERGREPEPFITIFKVIQRHQSEGRYLLYVNFKQSFFQDILTDNYLGDSMYMALVSPQGMITFASPAVEPFPAPGELRADTLQEKGVCTLHSAQNQEYYFAYDTIALNGWKLAAVVSPDELFSFGDYFLRTMALLAGMMLALTALILLAGARIVTRPIERWVQKMRALEENQLDIAFDEVPCAEFEAMNTGFRYLVDRIKQLLSDMHSDYEKKRVLELQILQQQINPHFIYNTLYSIQQLCKIGQSERAIQVTRNMANLFRISLSKGNEMVEVEDEVEHVRAYMDIQSMRYSQIGFRVEMQPDIAHCRIVKLILQPIVENAIYHGLYEADQGTIWLHGRRQGERVVFTIADDGAGIPPDELSLLQRCLASGDWSALPNAFGLKNVQERLRLHYGAPYGLTLESSPKGTTVQIEIPCELG